MSAQIYKFIEIIAAGGTEAASPTRNGTTIWSVATENREIGNTPTNITIENSQEVATKYLQRFSVRVYDMSIAGVALVNTGATGALALVAMHKGDGTGVKIDNVRVSALKQYDDPAGSYVLITCQADSTTQITDFT